MSYYQFIRFMGAWAVRLFNPVKIIGPKKFDKKRTVFIMNHISNMDPVLLIAYFRQEFRFVYKAEFDNKRFLNHLFHKMHHIPVRRGEADLKATKECLTALKNEEQIFIFPEGTRNKTEMDLLDFKTGPAMLALKTKSPIRPFYTQKAKKGRKRYIIIGEEFELDEFYEGGLSKENVQAATEYMKQKVVELKNILKEQGV